MCLHLLLPHWVDESVFGFIPFQSCVSLLFPHFGKWQYHILCFQPIFNVPSLAIFHHYI